MYDFFVDLFYGNKSSSQKKSQIGKYKHWGLGLDNNVIFYFLHDKGWTVKHNRHAVNKIRTLPEWEDFFLCGFTSSMECERSRTIVFYKN